LSRFHHHISAAALPGKARDLHPRALPADATQISAVLVPATQVASVEDGA
jgi:hypothetical protein